MDIAFLAFFRAYFGAMMLWEIWDLHSKGLIRSIFVEPSFHFTYHGFSWVRPWPSNGMYWHFAGLAVLSAFVMVGFLYRISSVLLWLAFTYVFLIEKAIYLNHYYLMCLLCFLLAFLPAERAWSCDAWLRPSLRSNVAPAWTLWLLRFQIGIPYVFGGLAKLQADWLQGQPMQMWLSISGWRVILGPVAEEHWFALLFSWGGLAFDLTIVPLLLWPRTRLLALSIALVFHLLNAFMFDIGIFPWLMIGATTVFLAPDWPRRLITPPPGAPPLVLGTLPPSSTFRRRVVLGLLAAHALVQVALPFRSWLYPGNVLWTEEGSMFAWKMMLKAKVNALRFVLVDAETGDRTPLDPTRWLTPQQIESMGHDPEMMREFAEHVGRQYQQQGKRVEVRVLALCSLNGRKPQPLILPRTDLAQQPRTLAHQRYIEPLREPLRFPLWNVPVADWEAHLAGSRD